MIDTSSPLYQNCTPTPASGSPTAPNAQGEPDAKHQTVLLVILSLVCKCYINEAHCIVPNPLLKMSVCKNTQNPREMDKCRNGVPHINHIRHMIDANIRCRTIIVQGHHRPSRPPSARNLRLLIIKTFWYMSQNTNLKNLASNCHTFAIFTDPINIYFCRW